VSLVTHTRLLAKIRMYNLNIISTITKSSFLEKWTKAEVYNKEHERNDQNSWDRIKVFSKKNLNIHLVEITPDETFSNLIIPYHSSPNHFFKTRIGGNTLTEFTDKYSYPEDIENSQDKCLERFPYHFNLFKHQKDMNQGFIEPDFMYFTQNVELSPDPHSRDGDFLYAGSFHQFAAYGLFVKEFGSIPLRLYLCNNT